MINSLAIPTAAQINQQAAREQRHAAQAAARQQRQSAQAAAKAARLAAHPAKPKGPLPVAPAVPGLNTQGQTTSNGYDANGNPLPTTTTTDVMMNGMTVPQGQQLSPMLATQMVPASTDNAAAWNFMGPELMKPLVANFETDRHDLTRPPVISNGLTIPPR